MAPGPEEKDRLSGPCCCAFWRYEEKVSGREWDGDIGCACGAWSSSGNIISIVRLGEMCKTYWLVGGAFR